MSHPMYEAYLSDMKRLGASKPYMTEAQCLESAGVVVEEQHMPILQIRPKKDARPIRATFDNFIEQKVQLPKKQKVERKPRNKNSEEERLKVNAYNRERYHKTSTRKKRVKLSEEQLRANKTEYMRKWRKEYLQSEKGRAKRREINSRYAERNRKKLNADAVRRYHENKAIK